MPGHMLMIQTVPLPLIIPGSQQPSCNNAALITAHQRLRQHESTQQLLLIPPKHGTVGSLLVTVGQGSLIWKAGAPVHIRTPITQLAPSNMHEATWPMYLPPTAAASSTTAANRLTSWDSCCLLQPIIPQAYVRPPYPTMPPLDAMAPADSITSPASAARRQLLRPRRTNRCPGPAAPARLQGTADLLCMHKVEVGPAKENNGSFEDEEPWLYPAGQISDVAARWLQPQRSGKGSRFTGSSAKLQAAAQRSQCALPATRSLIQAWRKSTSPQGGGAEAISCVKVWSQGLANCMDTPFFQVGN
jgi:hypothetical protein